MGHVRVDKVIYSWILQPLLSVQSWPLCFWGQYQRLLSVAWNKSCSQQAFLTISTRSIPCAVKNGNITCEQILAYNTATVSSTIIATLTPPLSFSLSLCHLSLCPTPWQHIINTTSRISQKMKWPFQWPSSSIKSCHHLTACSCFRPKALAQLSLLMSTVIEPFVEEEKGLLVFSKT